MNAAQEVAKSLTLEKRNDELEMELFQLRGQLRRNGEEIQRLRERAIRYAAGELCTKCGADMAHEEVRPVVLPQM